MSEKKSKTVNIRSVISKITRAAVNLSEDKITVYAAQASFFIVISAIPFIMLLISLSSYIIPEGVYRFITSIGENLPNNFQKFYMDIISELYSRPAIKLISLTAITAFWSASKGIAAVRGGVATVYKSNPNKGFLSNIVVSLLYTAAFFVLIIALIVILLFGEQLYGTMKNYIKPLESIEAIFKYRTGIFFVFITLFFNALYYAINRKGHEVDKKFKYHFPGAIIAAAGWVCFSYFYSLYTIYFSGASYIYGSLTAVVLLMLWLYFCMIILLFGAEFNKMLAIKRKESKAKTTRNSQSKVKRRGTR